MIIFSALTPPEFVAIDTLGELVTAPRNNRYLLATSDSFSKLFCSVPLRAVTTECVARALVTHWIMAYDPPRMFLSKNGKQSLLDYFSTSARS